MANPRDLLAAGGERGFHFGNVYIVAKRAETWFNDFEENYGGVYNDGSQVIHAVASGANADIAIQSALDACVASRGDRVFIMPSADDYDIYAALTMSKKSVSLISQEGLGYEVGGRNAVRLHQLTAATPMIAVTGQNVEIAGLFLKNYSGISAITLAASTYTAHIHHNFFAMFWVDSAATTQPMIAGTGDAGGWGCIEGNQFISYAGNGATCAAVVNIGASATGARVRNNEFTIGDTNIATLCISNQAVKGRTDFNTFAAAVGSTITKCISIGATGAAIGNRGAVTTALMVAGGTVDRSFVDNFAGLNGGTVQDNDTAA